jgi:hypothetical protein
MRSFPPSDLPITPALVCLVLGNLADGVATLVLLQFHDADETNPLMAGFYSSSPFAFMAAKLALVHGSILLAAVVPNSGLKQGFVRFGALVYLAVLAYQSMLFATSPY